MKAQTKIRMAVQLHRRIFVDHAKIVMGVPVIARQPRVEWRAGLGWYIDGKREPGTSSEVVDRYQAKMDDLAQRIKDFRAGRRTEADRPPR